MAREKEKKQISEYLRTRPIAPVLAQSDEKDSLNALKVMLILDYEMERNQLYARIESTNSDQLLVQLMQFHTFESFKFYDCILRKEIKLFALQCTVCGLLGPCGYILSHMAINHDLHMGLKMCLYCDRVELNKHFDNNSLDRCYRNYLRERNITEMDTNVCGIVTDFYACLKKIADKISTVTIRGHTYAAKRTHKRLNSVSVASLGFEEEFKRIKTVLNIQDGNLSKPPRMDMAGSSQVDDDDDEVMFVGEIKSEPSLDIQASQDEPTTSGMYCDNRGRDTPMMDSMSTALLLPPSNNFERNDAERFGLFVAQSLAKLPTDIQRRKLEIQIETAILNAKKAAFQ